MTSRSYHRPVLTEAVVELFLPVPDGIVVDATFGGGGHTRALSERLGERVTMIGVDRDPDARANAGDITVLAGSFGDLDRLLDEAGIDTISGALFDLGISSHQVDDPRRGFSYREDGPLDMRMDPTQGRTAADLVNTASEADLVRILRTYGEERFASSIARAIVRHRPFTRTLELSEVIAGAVPAAVRRAGHPARQAFQAFRIEVNGELDALRAGLEAALARLAPGGRCAVISYHSLEDRIVKRRFAELTEVAVPHPDLPVLVESEPAPYLAVTRKAIKPGTDEVTANPRARSARLRCIERSAA
ncbi:MAG TPA: 16S rRNA (cytosine(1402)-N(4))-methyltransferase RsmH [Acidimicrobiia bacterium]|nr:16S rRNA (cytosine(1402)-N(4))-methyltransferase RsmH [Acidimicrobiia bacterium]